VKCRRRRFLLTLLLGFFLLGRVGRAQGIEEDFSDLEELYAWGAVSSIVEIDKEGDGRIVGFLLNTDEGESFEIVMDDLGRRLAKETSDRTDVVVEVEGYLSIDRLLVTIRDFKVVFVDPNDVEIEEEEEGG
jgi:hypothetical protein